MFSETEANERLGIIAEVIERSILKDSMLAETQKLLKTLLAIAQGKEKEMPPEPQEKPVDHLIISCDASIKNNPGGPAAIAAVVQFPDSKKTSPEIYEQLSTALTNNVAEYEAVYFALTTLMNRHNNPTHLIEVRSDSRLVVCQLNKTMECNDGRLKKLRDAILEFVAAIPVPVIFRWLPRNCTPELTQANYICQDALGVKRH